MTEAEGCALLLARFTEAGYSITPNFHFHEGAIEVDLDGWDPTARVGYEYITREAGDDRQFDGPTLERFEREMELGALFVLLIDERDAVTAELLDMAAKGFLAETATRRPGSR